MQNREYHWAEQESSCVNELAMTKWLNGDRKQISNVSSF